MLFISDLKESNDLLSSNKGASVDIAIFSLSFKRLALKLTLPKFKEVLYVSGAGCEFIKGNFTWLDADIKIEVENKNGEYETKIFDTKAQFELITSGGFALALGMLSEFGDSFENFLKSG